VLVPVLILGAIVIAQPVAGADQAPTPVPAAPADTPRRPLSLRLDHLLDQDATRHAEFNLSARRVIWEDKMVRLALALEREEAAARRGGQIGVPVPMTASSSFLPVQGPDLRLVLGGPLAADWHDLSPREKVGRVTETVVTYGIIFEIVRGLQGPRR